jgi:hypothetical protein
MAPHPADISIKESKSDWIKTPTAIADDWAISKVDIVCGRWACKALI